MRSKWLDHNWMHLFQAALVGASGRTNIDAAKIVKLAEEIADKAFAPIAEAREAERKADRD